jgi:hypothetical protein
MATVTTVGRVEYLKVASGLGFVNIRLETPTGYLTVPPVPPGPTNELLIIWFGSTSMGPPEQFRTELSRALAHGLRVRLSHADDSAYITQVIVEAPFEGSLM